MKSLSSSSGRFNERQALASHQYRYLQRHLYWELQRYLHRVSSASPLPDGRLRSLVPMTAPLPLTLLILTLLTLTLSAAVRVSEEIADKNELICK